MYERINNTTRLPRHIATSPKNRLVLFFFFQAEDGIRDGTVTGVQTCALPISVQELDYIPLRAARQVEVPRHQTHGLVLPGLAGPYYSELLSGFEAAAARYGQSVVLRLAHPSVDLEHTVRQVLPRVDGLVLANDTVSDAFVRQVCRSTPTVL